MHSSRLMSINKDLHYLLTYLLTYLLSCV